MSDELSPSFITVDEKGRIGAIFPGTIVAGNIRVESLSEISPNLGTITAGIVQGATIRTAAKGRRIEIDEAGLRAYSGEAETSLNFDSATGNLTVKVTSGLIRGTTFEAGTAGKEELLLNSHGLTLKTGNAEVNTIAWSPNPAMRFTVGGMWVREIEFGKGLLDEGKLWSGNNRSNARMYLQSVVNESPSGNFLLVEASEEKTSASNQILASLGNDASQVTLLQTGQKSSFLQLVATAKRRVNFGVAEATYSGSSIEATQAVAHGLGVTPQFAAISPEDAGYVGATKAYGETNFTAAVQKRDGTTPASGTKAKFHWIAIG